MLKYLFITSVVIMKKNTLPMISYILLFNYQKRNWHKRLPSRPNLTLSNDGKFYCRNVLFMYRVVLNDNIQGHLSYCSFCSTTQLSVLLLSCSIRFRGGHIWHFCEISISAVVFPIKYTKLRASAKEFLMLVDWIREKSLLKIDIFIYLLICMCDLSLIFV